MEEWLTVEEVCALFKVKRGYLYNLTYRNEIPHYKLNGLLRFRASEVEAWMQSKRAGFMLAESEARYAGAKA